MNTDIITVMPYLMLRLVVEVLIWLTPLAMVRWLLYHND